MDLDLTMESNINCFSYDDTSSWIKVDKPAKFKQDNTVQMPKLRRGMQVEIKYEFRIEHGVIINMTGNIANIYCSNPLGTSKSVQIDLTEIEVTPFKNPDVSHYRRIKLDYDQNDEEKSSQIKPEPLIKPRPKVLVSRYCKNYYIRHCQEYYKANGQLPPELTKEKLEYLAALYNIDHDKIMDYEVDTDYLENGWKDE